MTASRRLACAAILGGLIVALTPPVLHAADCDYMIVSATWAPHPHPDSIYIVLRPDVEGTPSSNPNNPTQLDMDININFNGAPLEPPHQVHLAWWQQNNNCTEPLCQPLVCRLKNWIYKGAQWTDQTVCTRDANQVCGCPPIGTPVAQQKPVPKPPGPGLIEVEIVPLNLSSCNPINPHNDRKSFSYPGKPGPVPGATPAMFVVVAIALSLAGMMVLRRRAEERAI